MNLKDIVNRIADGIQFVDMYTSSTAVNARTGATYGLGVPAMAERQTVKEICNWWRSNHKSDFGAGIELKNEVPYFNSPRNKCDIVIGQQNSKTNSWGVEIKRIQFVGNNGKNNDFNVQKILSPYLKDRSLIHDIDRMRHDPIAGQQCVIAYVFEYDFKSCKQALKLHPKDWVTIRNIEEVCRKNDPSFGLIQCDPLVQMADHQFRTQGLVVNSAISRRTGLWRHPCGGTVSVFGWEIK
jgi:hypothetical protein